MRSLFLLASLRAVPLYCPPRIRGCPARVRGETKVVSTATCATPQSGRPLAMTSILLSSWVSTWSMLRSMILVLVGWAFAKRCCCKLQYVPCDHHGEWETYSNGQCVRGFGGGMVDANVREALDGFIGDME